MISSIAAIVGHIMYKNETTNPYHFHSLKCDLKDIDTYTQFLKFAYATPKIVLLTILVTTVLGMSADAPAGNCTDKAVWFWLRRRHVAHVLANNMPLWLWHDSGPGHKYNFLTMGEWVSWVLQQIKLLSENAFWTSLHICFMPRW